MGHTPLHGIKVIEMGTLIAGPFAARLMAEFGAEVIKIESPKDGDPLRQWRKLHDGTSLWWYVQARNKKSVTINLKKEAGQKIIRELVKDADIVIENFRPGVMEGWNLGWEQLSTINPRLIMVRISGYGQTGPYRDRPGFGAIGESMGGLRHLTGYPEQAPVRVGVSIGDSIAAMHGVMGALMALHQRTKGDGKGQVVDVALYESVFNLMESLLPEYGMFDFIRNRSGAALPGITPSNTYPCRDKKYVVIGANADSIFRRLMIAIGRNDLANDPELVHNDGRVPRTNELDEVIAAWTMQHSLDEILEALSKAEVPVGKIYDIADIVNDTHYQARGMIQQFELPDGCSVKLPGIVPKLSRTPGETRWIGPKLGAHTAEVLYSLGYDEAAQETLKADGII
ncbi:MAG: CoA transferase [Nitrosospira sp.]|nr:CoA transferase [Nitrosospira sp.]MBI0409154.1 CoA transferase [Nitrosospira sp.]MBI0410049.1 CoA transferase [Nitrosospira sp.]MBI0411155.1 CoA transferase [Nitrosospira sp.]